MKYDNYHFHDKNLQPNVNFYCLLNTKSLKFDLIK